MKKYYYTKKPVWMYVLSVLVIIIGVAGLVVNILSLLEVGRFTADNRGIHIFNIVWESLLTLVCLGYLLLSFIVFSEDRLTVVFNFRIVRAPYKDVLLLRRNSSGTELYLFVKTAGRGMVKDEESGVRANVVQVAVHPRYFDEIVAAIREKNRQAVLEIYPDLPKKERKK